MSLALSHLTDHLIHSSLHYMLECANICPIHQTTAAFKILKNVFRGWETAQEGGRNTWTWCQELLFHSIKTTLKYAPSLSTTAPGTWCSDYKSAISWRHNGQTFINLHWVQFKICVSPETCSSQHSSFHKQRIILFLATLADLVLIFCWSATWLQGF